MNEQVDWFSPIPKNKTFERFQETLMHKKKKQNTRLTDRVENKAQNQDGRWTLEQRM